jgi:probable HAF family extracellular repeat protein
MNYIRSLILTAVACTASVAYAQYTAYDLGPGLALAINSAGTIVGSSPAVYSESGTSYRPLQWSGGVVSDLASLGGPCGIASAVNDHNVIVGWSCIGDATWPWHGFRNSNGTVTDLGVLNYDSIAWAINNAGTIVGDSVLGDSTRAVIYQNGVMSDLGTLSGVASSASGINNAGTIVGWSQSANGADHAFRYSGGSWSDLGTLGSRNSTSLARDINDAGAIVGSSQIYDLGPDHAVLFTDAGITDLGTLGGANSQARAINSAGVIVGESEVAPWVNHAFVYRDGVMIDLDPLLVGIGLTGGSTATDINDNGDIVGTAMGADGVEHAFVLQVPEPSGIGVLAVGLGGLILRSARRTRRPA